jgi:hypothetical protein
MDIISRIRIYYGILEYGRYWNLLTLTDISAITMQTDILFLLIVNKLMPGIFEGHIASYLSAYMIFLQVLQRC